MSDESSSERAGAGNRAQLSGLLAAPAAAPTTHPPFLLSERALVPGGSTQYVGIACLADGCLAAWTQAGHLVARRLTLAGEALGDRVLDLGADAPFLLGTSDDRYTVAAIGQDGYFSTIGADGQLAETPLTLPYGQVRVAGIASSGDVTAISFEKSIQDEGLMLGLWRIRNGALLGSEITLGVTVPMRTALGSGAGQLVATRDTALYRIDPDSGTTLAGEPTTFTKYKFTPSSKGPALAFDGQNHLVSWVEAGALYTARVRASDGTLLEPDDDFNELPGARRICANLGAITDLWTAVRGGNLIYVLRQNGSLRSIVVPLASWSTLAACSVQDLGVSGDPLLDALPDAVAFPGDRVLHVWRNYWEMRSILQDVTQTPAQSGPSRIVNFHAPDRAPLGVASSGADFIAAYLDQEQSRWRVLRIDDETGTVLGPELDYSVLNSEANGSLALESNGSNYLVAAATNKGTRLIQRLGCRGELGPRRMGTATGFVRKLASDGDRYLLADSSGYTLRLDSEGNILDSAKLGGQDELVAVAADRNPDPERRTFLVLSSNNQGLYAHRIRSATGTVLAPITLYTPLEAFDQVRGPFLTSNGADFLAGWVEKGPYVTGQGYTWTEELALLDPLSAEPRVSHSSPVDSDQVIDRRLGTYDGATLTTWRGTHPLQLRRWDGDLVPIDAKGALDSGVPGISTSSLQAGSNLKGRTLFVYTAFDPAQLGYAIYGQFVDNGVEPADLPEGVCDDSPGSTGDGGANAGGAGGNPGGNEGGHSGGVPTSGGTNNSGGRGNEGGSVSLGGATGEAGNGGVTGEGGTAGVTGEGGTAGAPDGGGAPGAGGATSTGGSDGTGGDSVASGGTGVGQGGATAAGGAVGSGGASTGASGEATTSGGGPTTQSDDGGCSCRLPRGRDQRSPAASALAALALVSFARRRRYRALFATQPRR